MHDFLYYTDGEGITRCARKIPMIREYVRGMPETRTVFTLADALEGSDLDGSRVATVHMEFIGVWRMPPTYPGESHRGHRWVNPDSPDAARYADAVARCECGTIVDSTERSPTDHADGCEVGWRRDAREAVAETRREILVRCGRLGWTAPDYAERFGVGVDDVAVIAGRHGIDVDAMARKYREEAAETYHYLTTAAGEDPADVADVYGETVATLREWRQEYAIGRDLTLGEAGQ